MISLKKTQGSQMKEKINFQYILNIRLEDMQIEKSYTSQAGPSSFTTNMEFKNNSVLFIGCIIFCKEMETSWFFRFCYLKAVHYVFYYFDFFFWGGEGRGGGIGGIL